MRMLAMTSLLFLLLPQRYLHRRSLDIESKSFVRLCRWRSGRACIELVLNILTSVFVQDQTLCQYSEALLRSGEYQE